METFDALKDFELDFLDMQESNPQYDQVFSKFGLVFKDLLYRKIGFTFWGPKCPRFYQSLSG